MKLSYQQLVVLILAWQRRMPPGPVKEFTGLSYTTIARWSWRFRKHLPQDNGLLEGIVEVDEAFFGRKRHHNQLMVVGAVERYGRLRLRIIADREQDTLEAFLLASVDTKSQVCTDGWSSYQGIQYYGYDHWMCNHSEYEFGETNIIESVWSNCKRQLRRMYGKLNNQRWLATFMRELEARYNFPELFKNPIDYLQVCLVPA
jgi:IS1 family transposase